MINLLKGKKRLIRFILVAGVVTANFIIYLTLTHLSYARLSNESSSIPPKSQTQFAELPDIQITVVEERFQFGHVAVQETAILADAVPAHG